MALSFVPNAGQTDARVRYQAQAPVTGSSSRTPARGSRSADGSRATALELGFLGSRSTIAPLGERPTSAASTT